MLFFTFLSTSNNAFAASGAELFKTCVRCHGEDGAGRLNEKAPKIAGQYDWYILKALNDFKSGARKNPAMLPYLKNLSQNDFKELASYASKLKVK